MFKAMRWFRGRLLAPIFLMIILLFFLWGCGGGGGEGVNSGASFILNVNGSNLSVKIKNAPLGKVLEELGKKANIKVFVEGSAAMEGVSAEFKNLPLEEGIRQILKGKNYALTYAQPSVSGNSSVSSQVIIGIKVVQSGSVPLDGISTAIYGVNEGGKQKSLDEVMREASGSSDPLKRASALRTLGDHVEEAKAFKAVATALQDEDPYVRGVALEILGETGDRASIDSVVRVALNDPIPSLRMNAFGLLIDIDEGAAKGALKQAMSDSDPRVRKMAEGLLKELQEDDH